jgi:hypothetical protein
MLIVAASFPLRIEEWEIAGDSHCQNQENSHPGERTQDFLHWPLLLVKGKREKSNKPKNIIRWKI